MTDSPGPPGGPSGPSGPGRELFGDAPAQPAMAPQAPARQPDRVTAVIPPCAGGPVKPPAGTGEEPTPGSAVVVVTARESSGVVAGAGAAFRSEGGRAGRVSGTPGAVSESFAVPDTRVPLVFDTAPRPHPTGPIEPPIPQPPPPGRL